MTGKILELLKHGHILIPMALLQNYKKLKLTDKELIILIYLINSDKTFNPKKISKDLNFKLNETMSLITSLTDKGIIKINVINKKVREEVFNLDELYNKLAFLIINCKAKL